ncbi:UNVERIFIED_CONTAM: hypothetical protein FKN15_071530 [Acipenser sinensis]
MLGEANGIIHAIGHQDEEGEYGTIDEEDMSQTSSQEARGEHLGVSTLASKQNPLFRPETLNPVRGMNDYLTSMIGNAAATAGYQARIKDAVHRDPNTGKVLPLECNTQTLEEAETLLPRSFANLTVSPETYPASGNALSPSKGQVSVEMVKLLKSTMSTPIKGDLSGWLTQLKRLIGTMDPIDQHTGRFYLMGIKGLLPPGACLPKRDSLQEMVNELIKTTGRRVTVMHRIDEAKNLSREGLGHLVDYISKYIPEQQCLDILMDCINAHHEATPLPSLLLAKMNTEDPVRVQMEQAKTAINQYIRSKGAKITRPVRTVQPLGADGKNPRRQTNPPRAQIGAERSTQPPQQSVPPHPEPYQDSRPGPSNHQVHSDAPPFQPRGQQGYSRVRGLTGEERVLVGISEPGTLYIPENREQVERMLREIEISGSDEERDLTSSKLMLWTDKNLIATGLMSFQPCNEETCASCGRRDPVKYLEVCKTMKLCKGCYEEAYGQFYIKEGEPNDRIFVIKIAPLMKGNFLKERVPDRDSEGSYVYDSEGKVVHTVKLVIDHRTGEPMRDAYGQLECPIEWVKSLGACVTMVSENFYNPCEQCCYTAPRLSSVRILYEDQEPGFESESLEEPEGGSVTGDPEPVVTCSKTLDPFAWRISVARVHGSSIESDSVVLSLSTDDSEQNKCWVPADMSNSEFWPPTVFWMDGIPLKVSLCEQKEMHERNMNRSRMLVRGTELALVHEMKSDSLVMCDCDRCRGRSSRAGPKPCPACSHLVKHCRILFECDDSEGLSFSHLNVNPRDVKRIECMDCEGDSEGLSFSHLNVNPRDVKRVECMDCESGHPVKWAHLGKLECEEGVPIKRVQVSCRYKVKTMATHTCDAKRWIKGPIVVFAEPTRDEPRTEMESCWERAEALDMDWMI